MLGTIDLTAQICEAVDADTGDPKATDRPTSAGSILRDAGLVAMGVGGLAGAWAV